MFFLNIFLNFLEHNNTIKINNVPTNKIVLMLLILLNIKILLEKPKHYINHRTLWFVIISCLLM